MSAVPPMCRVVGGWVQPWTPRALVEWSAERALHGRRVLLGNHNMHSLALLAQTPAMQRFYQRCDGVFVDGMPLITLARLQGHRFGRLHRNTLVDWLPLVVRRVAAEGGRWCHVGGDPATVDRGIHGLVAGGWLPRRPETVLLSGFFDSTPGSTGWNATVATINRCRPALLTVGMGMPRQELFLASAIDHLDVGLAMTVGGWLDIYVENRPWPPRWMGRCGLEWMHRLWLEPRRVGRRYLVEPWGLLPRVVSDLGRRGWRRSARPDQLDPG